MQDNFSDDKRPDQSPGVSNDEESGSTATYWRGRRRRNRSQSSRLFFAAFLIIAGTLLFLGNLGLFPVRNIWDYWPLWLVVVGVGKLLSARHAAGQALGALLVVFGALFLTVTLGIFHINARDDSWPLSLLLIAFGAIALIKTLEAGRGAKPAVGFSSQPPVSSDNLIHDAAVFGSDQAENRNDEFSGWRRERDLRQRRPEFEASTNASDRRIGDPRHQCFVRLRQDKSSGKLDNQYQRRCDSRII